MMHGWCCCRSREMAWTTRHDCSQTKIHYGTESRGPPPCPRHARCHPQCERRGIEGEPQDSPMNTSHRLRPPIHLRCQILSGGASSVKLAGLTARGIDGRRGTEARRSRMRARPCKAEVDGTQGRYAAKARAAIRNARYRVNAIVARFLWTLSTCSIC